MNQHEFEYLIGYEITVCEYSRVDTVFKEFGACFPTKEAMADFYISAGMNIFDCVYHAALKLDGTQQLVSRFEQCREALWQSQERCRISQEKCKELAEENKALKERNNWINKELERILRRNEKAEGEA